MKLLFDQNISHRILNLLPKEYAESTTVKSEGLIDADDKRIWDFAKKNNYIVVTQDSDFNNFNLLLGFPPKIIWIRTGNMSTQDIVNLLIDYAEEIKNFVLDNNYGCLELFKFKH